MTIRRLVPTEARGDRPATPRELRVLKCAYNKIRHKATLFGMYVPPRFRGPGLGRQLVAAALEFARSRAGVEIVQLTVTRGNASAEALYRSCGFVEFGVEPLAAAVGSGYVSKLHLWCDVDPAVKSALPTS